MWPFSPRRPRSAKRPASLSGSSGLRLPVRGIGSLSPGHYRVIVGEGIGLIDHHETDWPAEWLPEAERRPNGEFAILGFVDGVPQVVTGPVAQPRISTDPARRDHQAS